MGFLDFVGVSSTAGSGVVEDVGEIGVRPKLRMREGMIQEQIKLSVSNAQYTSLRKERR